MAYQTGTATDTHNMLSLMSTFLAANGWTVDRDAVDGAGRQLQVSSGESFFSMRSNTTETLATLDIPIRISNLVEPGIFINGNTGYNVAQGWNRQPGRMGRWSDGNPIPYWLDTDGNTGSFTYHMFAWTTPVPEVWLVVEYAGTDRWTFLCFGELEEIHDWGFTRGVPFFSASRDTYRNSSLITDSNYGARGPLGNWGSNGISNFACMFKPAFINGDTGFTGPPDDLAGTSPWASSTSVTSINSVWGYTGRHVYGMATQIGEDLVRAHPSTFNSAEVLIPFYVTRGRNPALVDGQSGVDEYNHSFQGVASHSRYVDMTNLLPTDELVIGGDTWMVFPNHYKGQTTDTWYNGGGEANMGFAVRKA